MVTALSEIKKPRSLNMANSDWYFMAQYNPVKETDVKLFFVLGLGTPSFNLKIRIKDSLQQKGNRVGL